MRTILSSRFIGAVLALVTLFAASAAAGPLPPRRPRFSLKRPYDPQLPLKFDQTSAPHVSKRLGKGALASLKDQASEMHTLVLHGGSFAKRLSAVVAGHRLGPSAITPDSVPKGFAVVPAHLFPNALPAMFQPQIPQAREFKLPPGSPSRRERTLLLAPVSDLLSGVSNLSLNATGVDHQELAALHNFLLSAGASGFEHIALAETPLTFADGHAILGYAQERRISLGDSAPDF